MKKKIMIVDDNLDVLSMVKKGIERLTDEYELIGVDSGEKCFELLNKNHTPDLILLDIMMPETNGWDVLARLRSEKSWEKIPVIFLTAKTDDFSKGFGILTSAGFITKPFKLDDLNNRIKEFFERGHLDG